MAVYNGEKYIKEAIESVLSQSFRDFEFIIVNDASTDNTKKIIECYKKNDSRIIIINNEKNLERSLSRNKGIESARGEYIAFIDADDVVLPEKLERQVAFLDRHKDVAFVGTSWYEIDAIGNIISLQVLPETKGADIVHFMCKPSIIARKDSIVRVGAFRADFRVAEDYELWLRVSEVGLPAQMSEPLYKYRLHPNSTMATNLLEVHIATSMAIWLAERRKKNSCEEITQSAKAEIARVWNERIKSSWYRQEKIISNNHLIWSKAACSLDLRKAFYHSVKALVTYPCNWAAWGILYKITKQDKSLWRKALLRFFHLSKKQNLYNANKTQN